MEKVSPKVVKVESSPVLGKTELLPQNGLVNNLQERKSNKIYLLFVGVAIFGILSGKVMASTSANSSTSSGATKKNVGGAKVVDKANEAGINDEKAFPDTAQGILKEGGMEGEGTHHLDRGMGANKDVYISSTVINLDNFVGKKVEVRGQTISGKKAGWLMDVGKIKTIE